MKKLSNALTTFAAFMLLVPFNSLCQQKLRLGFSIHIDKITAEGMAEAKAASVDCIETFFV